MNDEHDDEKQNGSTGPSMPESRYRALRVWPAILLVIGMLAARWTPSMIEDAPAWIWMVSAFGPLFCGLFVMLWWLMGSRASWVERIVGLSGLIGAAVVTILLLHKTMLGPAAMIVTIPLGTAGFAVGASLVGRYLSFNRTMIALLVAVVGFGFSTLLRNEGVWGDFELGLHWRWVPSAEDQMLAQMDNRNRTDLSQLQTEQVDQGLLDPEWPAFRGADRSGRQRGTILDPDWGQYPPEELWRITVGPAWSSFVVAGDLLFTQEQRGQMEAVVCYSAESGAEIWVHELESRFDDPLGGPGPRATPTLMDGGLYALGANGVLIRMDPRTGQEVWQQDLRTVANRQPPMWGFSSSPLVTGDAVIVYAGADDGKGTLAFDCETGELIWSVEAGPQSYSSAQFARILGTDYVQMMTDRGFKLLDPSTGDARYKYEWPHSGYRALQPHVIGDDSVLIPTGLGTGTRRIVLSESAGQLTEKELWTTRNLKSDFNDLVIYQGHIYGFDGSILTCVDVDTGERIWRRGRYGKGQLLLLEDSGHLLVISEKGKLVLLPATPLGHKELGTIEALNGKTWNHPVVVGDRLYLRNANQAVCYRLALSQTTDSTTPAAPSGQASE